MTWRARFRARKRRRALGLLLPTFSAPRDDYEVLTIAIPIRKELLHDTHDFHERGALANLVGQQAFIAASQKVRERCPVKFPDHVGNTFKEGWKGHGD